MEMAASQLGSIEKAASQLGNVEKAKGWLIFEVNFSVFNSHKKQTWKC